MGTRPVDLDPENGQSAEASRIIVRLGERRRSRSARRIETVGRNSETLSEESLPPQAPGGLNAALLRWQDPAVADGAAAGRRRFHIVAMERVPKPCAGHIAPDRAQPTRVAVLQVPDRREPGPLQTRAHAPADTRQFLRPDIEQRTWQVAGTQHCESIRLIEVRGDLGEPSVGCATDGAGDVLANGFTHEDLFRSPQ